MTGPDAPAQADALALLTLYTDTVLTLNGLMTVATLDSSPDALLDDAVTRTTHEVHFLRDQLLAQQPAPAPATTDERLEVVSAAVHDDWMASKLAQGVTSRCGQDGEEYMVPYAQLSEAAKELDRVTVRAVLKHVLPAEALAAENQRLRAALREMLTTFSAVTSRHEADVTHRARIALNAELPGGQK